MLQSTVSLLTPNAPFLTDINSATQLLQIVSNVMAQPLEASATVAMGALGFTLDAAAAAAANASAPFPPAMSTALLAIASSMLAYAANPPGSLSEFSLSLEQQRSIAAMVSQTNALIARSLLIGAVPGQAPSVLETPSTAISAFRQTSAALSGLADSCLSCATVVASTSFGFASSNSGSFTAASLDLPATALREAAIATGDASPAVVDTIFAVNRQNIFGFADRQADAIAVTDAPVVSFSIVAAGTGRAVAVRGLGPASRIAIRIPHGSRPGSEVSRCRFWNETALAWSTDGCAQSTDSANATVCVCSHLTAFNVAKVLVPPIRAISAQDIADFFSWQNIREHPLPVICMGALVVAWLATSALVLLCTPQRCAAAFACGGRVEKSRQLPDDAEAGALNEASYQPAATSAMARGACCFTGVCTMSHDAFPPTTLPAAALFAYHMADLPDEQTDEQRAAALGWMFDPRIWRVFTEQVSCTLRNCCSNEQTESDVLLLYPNVSFSYSFHPSQPQFSFKFGF